MKKIFCAVTLLLLLLSSGCKGAMSDSEVMAMESENTYVVSKGTIEYNEINIEYPVIGGYVDEKSQERWNERIYEEVMSHIENLGESDVLSMEFDVTKKEDDFVSILVKGYRYYDGAAYPQVFKYTYNISLSEDTNIRLSDQYDTYQIAKYLLSGENYITEGIEKEEFLDYLNAAFEDAGALQEVINEFDFCYDEDLVPFGYSYYTQRAFKLCVEVPHALGDCVIVSFSYDNLENLEIEKE